MFSLFRTEIYESSTAAEKLERVMRYVKASTDINGMGNKMKIVAGTLKYQTDFLLTGPHLFIMFQRRVDTRGSARSADRSCIARLVLYIFNFH